MPWSEAGGYDLAVAGDGGRREGIGQDRLGGKMKLTPKQAAQRSGVSANLIYQWCNEKRIAHYRFGGQGRRGRILIEETDLDVFLATLRVEAEKPRMSLPALRHITLP
jgi:excisionase family DNA binding protein